jgi:alkanesulfonate monooxygenase SsuD/methylene tetrahydromethanopterin reductase-like flavin-dependent oxidoreductase (luciferase family)
MAERAARTAEALASLGHCWSGPRFSFSGRYFHYQDTLITPVPWQRPGPPVWMAAWSPAGLQRAARLADGWLADPGQSLPIVKRHASRYRAAAAEAGRTPFLCLMRDAVIANSMAEAEAASGPTMYTHRFDCQHGAYVPDAYLKDVTRPEALSFTKAAQDRLIVGSAEDCLAQLHRWHAEIQPDYLIIRLRQPGGPTHQATLEAIRAFGEQVIPKL